MPDRFLVTGALGCLGAWTVRRLVEEGASAVTFDLGTDTTRADLVLERPLREVATVVEGDITDLDALRAVLREQEITHVVHLAAMQVPFCAADPPLGARVNVVGTVNVFQAVAELGGRVPGVAYASSFAVFGDATLDVVTDDTPPDPRSHYGVYKAANEGTARVYWSDSGVASIGLRPYVAYGVGRDQGMTSGPSVAMLAAALGRGWHVPYSGRNQYQLASDAGAWLVHAARVCGSGAQVVTLDGDVEDMRAVVSMIESAAPEAAGLITCEEKTLPFPPEASTDLARQLFADVPRTPMAEGVEQTVAHFRRALAAGLLPESYLTRLAL
jgi:nucleoside-diphosphate-sugar epimerase